MSASELDMLGRLMDSSFTCHLLSQYMYFNGACNCFHVMLAAKVH